jgi:hypothetical protein
MAGTAANYMAGVLNIGTTTLSGFSLDVNGTARVQSTLISGGGTPLVLTGESFALQAISAGLPSGAVFGTNVANNPSFINILSGNNFWHISNRSSTNANRLGIFNASFTGTTPTYSSELLTISTTGSVGIASTTLTGYTLRTSKNITGAVTSYGVTSEGQIQSDVTSSARMFWTLPSIIGGHAVTDVYHYITGQGTFNGTATNQYGFVASSSLTGATNNFGFWGNVPSGTNRWNIYMQGTAANYMAGNLSIGTTTSLTTLQVSGDISIALDKGYGFIRSGIFVPVLKKYTSDDSLEINNINNSYISIKSNNTERVRVKSTGQMRFVPLASDPSGAEAGDVYYNSTTNKLKVYNGTTWETITSL